MKYKISIHAIFKDETQFLKEWLEYHLIVGVEHFFLLNHDDDKTESNALLQPYVNEGLVTNIPYDNQTGAFQLNGIRQVIKDYGYLTEWLCVIDLDEFIFPVNNMTIIDTLTELETDNIDGLYVSCCTFGSSYQIKIPKLITQTLIRKGVRNCTANQTSKNFYRPNQLDDFMLPKKDKKRMVNENGDYSPNDKYIRPMKKIRVNHYGIRSRKYWEEKIKRSQPGKRKGKEQFTPELWAHKKCLLDVNDILDTSMYKFKDILSKQLFFKL